MLCLGCAPVYKNLQKAEGDIGRVQQFKPVFINALYKTTVDVTGKHLSGLLLIKKMPDSTTRIVFSNEMGFKFFDFEFAPDGGFKVHSIIKQMDKKAVIKTLRKDFELVMMQPLNLEDAKILKDSAYIYYAFKQAKGSNYYVTQMDGVSLVRMEKSSKRKPVVVAIAKNYVNGVPDTIGISHKNVSFEIGLKRIKR